MIQPDKMRWTDARSEVVHFRGDEYYVKLDTTAKWVAAIESITDTLPKAFPTERGMILAYRSFQIIGAQVQIFAFNPVDGETADSRVIGTVYSDADPDNLSISADDYKQLVEAMKPLGRAMEDATLAGAGELWKPTRAEVVMIGAKCAYARALEAKAGKEVFANLLLEMIIQLQTVTAAELQREAALSDARKAN